MKKLISELESMARKLFRNPNANDDTCKGFDHALQIVRAHNPWHEVTELPPVCEQEPDFSIDVMLTDGERCRVGYYAFSTGSWIMHRYFKNPVTGWAYLPEGKP